MPERLLRRPGAAPRPPGRARRLRRRPRQAATEVRNEKFTTQHFHSGKKKGGGSGHSGRLGRDFSTNLTSAWRHLQEERDRPEALAELLPGRRHAHRTALVRGCREGIGGGGERGEVKGGGSGFNTCCLVFLQGQFSLYLANYGYNTGTSIQREQGHRTETFLINPVSTCEM